MTSQNSSNPKKIPKQKARVFSIVNQKGGVGKTTTAVNVAAAFAAMKKKTLLIDIDPQGNASTGFGIEQSQRQKTIYEILIGESAIKDSITPTRFSKLKIVTATVDLAACEIELGDVDNREFLLKSAIDEVINDFDYIFIDCPPSLGILTINALSASDSILIPMQCEFFSLEGLSHLLTTLDLVKENLNPNLMIAGIILTMYDNRNRLTSQVEADIRSFLGDKVFKNVIPRNIKLSEAPSHGLPAIVYDKNCKGSVSYIKLAKEILGTINLKKT